ncbi:hypothetical protein C8J57DRAFT_15637 [Mycena rebaudengoi]|nr:hypothetical protein C8J57DRAFT_15637 [Mycena rebaudengoi]
MPDKPADLFEPAWVNLVFDPHCHFCSRQTVRMVEWRLRVRICKNCVKTHIQESKEPSLEEGDGRDPPIESLVPRRPGKKGQCAYLTRDYQAVTATYSTLESLKDRRA